MRSLRGKRTETEPGEGAPFTTCLPAIVLSPNFSGRCSAALPAEICSEDPLQSDPSLSWKTSGREKDRSREQVLSGWNDPWQCFALCWLLRCSVARPPHSVRLLVTQRRSASRGVAGRRDALLSSRCVAAEQQIMPRTSATLANPFPHTAPVLPSSPLSHCSSNFPHITATGSSLANVIRSDWNN